MTRNLAMLTFAAVLCTALIAGPSRAARAAASDDGSAQDLGRPGTLVVGFENTSEDRSLYWVGEAISDGLSREIRQAGADALDRRERAAVRDELGAPTLSTLTLASQIRMAEELGARFLVTGSYAATGDQLTVRARVVSLALGQTGPWVTSSGSVRSLVAIQRELFGQLARYLPLSRRSSGQTATAEDGVPQGAYEFLLKSFLEDDADKKVKFLRRSLDLAPDYLRARLELAQLYREGGQLQKAADTLSVLVTRDPALAAEGETLLGEIEFDMGRSANAEASLRKSLALKETARAHLVLAKLAAARRDRPTAAAEAARSRALDPNDPDLLDVEDSIGRMK